MVQVRNRMYPGDFHNEVASLLKEVQHGMQKRFRGRYVLKNMGQDDQIKWSERLYFLGTPMY